MSIFDQEDTIPSYLAELTKPGGKFDRTKYASEQEMYEAIAKGKYHGDRTLDQRDADMDKLREDSLRWRNESTTQTKLDELLTRMENTGNNTNTNNTDGNGSLFDQNKFEEIAAQKALATYKQLQQEQKDSENLAKVESRIRERLGDNAPSILRDKLNSIGFTSDDLKDLAKRSPEAAINALGLNQQVSPTVNEWAPIKSNTRSDSFKQSAGPRDSVFYDKMRLENPKEYFSEKMSVQRLRDMDHPDFMKRSEEQVSRSF